MTLEYFRPWRRKIGLGLLVLSCCVAGLWFRGQSIQDSIWYGLNVDKSRWSHELGKTVTSGKRLDTMSSCANNGLVWGRWTSNSGSLSWISGWQTNSAQNNDFLNPFEPLGHKLDSERKIYHSRLLGIEIAKYRVDHVDTYAFCRVSHWSVAFPLALTSAWLLQSPCRTQREPAKKQSNPRTVNHV